MRRQQPLVAPATPRAAPGTPPFVNQQLPPAPPLVSPAHEQRVIDLVMASRILSPAEQKIADLLTGEGRKVEVLVESTQRGVRPADFIVDGVRTELKTVSNLTGKDLSASLSRRILDGAGQAPHIIVDATAQAGMTVEVARRAIARAYGAQQTHPEARI